MTRRFFAPNPVVLQASGAGWERRPGVPDDILGMIAVMMALLSRSRGSQNPLASRLPTSPTLLACYKVPSRPCPPTQVGSTLFAHGGVLRHHVEYGLERMNREAQVGLQLALVGRLVC